MGRPSMTYQDAVEFQRIWEMHKGDIHLVCDHMHLKERGIRAKRRLVEKFLGIHLIANKFMGSTNFPEYQNTRFDMKKDYTILIGSDKHNEPSSTPQAFLAFLHLAEDIKPDVIVINGDWFDFSAIGRWHRIGWQDQPDVYDELESGVACLNEVKKASPKSKRFFNLGNHDMRFDGKLANIVPELEGVKGAHLEDYLTDWNINLSVVFNDILIVKHRWHSGIHSSYNDVAKGGKNIATGHDHKLNIRPWTDYSGTRYGIKTGTLSDLWDETFVYTENNASDWQPGCAMIQVCRDIIIPETCPMVINKSHQKWGKIHYHGTWYG
jgi:predicted MPP superfamily phosphohydrolase